MERAEAPLVVTALLDPGVFRDLDRLRDRHFPAALNKVPAHISLFHHLPGAACAQVLADVREECAAMRPMPLEPRGLRFLGRGVAIAYEHEHLSSLRAALARRWRDWLTPQDRQPFKAHVTIQNKVAPAVARELLADLEGLVLPHGVVEGVAVWRYLGGPWDLVARCPFGVSPA